jgi:hypothetical protein
MVTNTTDQFRVVHIEYVGDHEVRLAVIGRSLIAAAMLLHDAGASSNISVQLVIDDATNRRTRRGYDRPRLLMERVGNRELSAAAPKPDARRAALAKRVTAR